jgi:hypothetical protein
VTVSRLELENVTIPMSFIQETPCKYIWAEDVTVVESLCAGYRVKPLLLVLYLARLETTQAVDDLLHTWLWASQTLSFIDIIAS